VRNLAARIAILVGCCYALLVFFYLSMATLAAQGRAGIVAIAFVVGAWFVSVPLAYVFAFVLNGLSKGLFGLWAGMAAGYVDEHLYNIQCSDSYLH
jgi:Na+-driven multidrug efflux pump